ncbi:bifunctional riboflavin biosynthesis protein RIBA 1, chloroplastic-like [Rutidosis leptorrhynchoides]|uniref:bifunctional riboflavin biosynthesis protein RIBA 1, chloroplastic-like n=1 Tax=Rutidosis leptorrhynchoides TaxID=125765 RepID=UPI003A9A3CDF
MAYSFSVLLLLIFLLIGSSVPSSSPSTTPSPKNFAIVNQVTIALGAVGVLAVILSLYKIGKADKLAKRVSAARVPTVWGSYVAYCYKAMSDGLEHVAMVKGEIGNGKDILVRVHSECLTGDIFRSARCDCGDQLELAMKQIEEAGRGVVVYLRGHEGRGIGLGHKLRAYNLQDDGRDTVQANEDLGLPIDSRDYSVGAQILKDLGVQTLRLMTNNPAKCIGLKGYGLEVVERVPVLTAITEDNKRYLETKRTKMGHVYEVESKIDLVEKMSNVLKVARETYVGIRIHNQIKGETVKGKGKEMILKDLGVQTLRLMTNNPAKCIGLKGYGLEVVERVPVLTAITEDNKRYLETKRTKMGHVYGAGTLH